MAKEQAVKEWLGTHIHGKPSDAIELLNKKLIGHYRYEVFAPVEVRRLAERFDIHHM